MWKQIRKREKGVGYLVRSATILPPESGICAENRRILVSLFCKASMTVETAIVLPLFLFAMITVLQFASLQITASALLAGMHETAKEMAVYAYVQDLGIGAGDSLVSDFVAGGISAVYAKGKIEDLAGDALGNGSFHLLESSFLVHEIIDIAATYQNNSALSLLPVKPVKAVMRARVRAWTGREGAEHKKDDTDTGQQEATDSSTVYVATTGTVYHKDPNCTHIRLSVSCVSKAGIDGRRNNHGGKYHACEKCGANAGSQVYITSDGNRYHSSLECSGIKRTVKECRLSEVEGMRACSRCGGT